MAYYTQLKEFERIRIFECLKSGDALDAIAQKIGRHKSTVSREIARNSDQIGYLYPSEAQKRTATRKAKHGSKVSRNASLHAYILKKALFGWSPVVIAGCWSKAHPNQSICAEAIYQFAYHVKNKALALWKLFPRAKKRRGITRKQRSTGGIMHRVSIHDRPIEIEAREIVGHYEADLMFNSGSQSANVLTIIERKSRMVMLVKHDSKHSDPIIESLKNRLGKSAKSCTFDNGKEFAMHYKLDIPTFFCDPGSPWQKGSVENMNGLLRRYLPFSLDPRIITQEYLDQVAHIMNNTPRKKLGFLTPSQVFKQNLKKENRVKAALPAAEVSFYQTIRSVALQH